MARPMISRLLESAKVRLFQTTDVYWSFARFKVVYKIIGPPEKKNYMWLSELILTAPVSENVSSQHEDENAVCHLTEPQGLLRNRFVRLIDHSRCY
jgi:hypothetical protein